MHRNARIAILAASCLGTAGLPPAWLSGQDTVRVRSTAAGQWGANVRLTPVFSIGQVDGPDETAFGYVAALVVDRRGNFFVHDGNDNQIRRYDPNGKFLRAIGRKGKGPGEYTAVSAMAITDDSVLVVHDYSTARVTYFLP